MLMSFSPYRRIVAAILPLLPAATFTSTVNAADDAGIAFFESKIRPVLSENCYQCHSAEAVANDKLKGGLQLDTRAGIRKGGDTGPAVVPSEVDASLILKALRHEGDLQMPPDNKLGDALVADFTRWIEMGAPDPRDGAIVEIAETGVDIEAGKQHWAFRPLTRPAPPKVAGEAWVRTPADRFIRAKLEAKRIESNPIAAPRTLIRRAYFDLIGLPPTPQQTDAFLADAANDFDGAWSRLIDRLLASQHYGERWGRHWLDLVRFAESNGYAFDKDRPTAWRYRDWVIRALNADMPYDEFVRAQLAGDIFAGTDWDSSEKAERALELVTATGFIVAGPFTTQQTQKERERSRYEQLDDMVHTLGTSMLGLTVGCARCHDHKYDPIGTHDYYEWAAMFSDVGFADVGVDLEPHIYRDEKSVWDKARAPLAAARAAREKELDVDAQIAAFVASQQDPAAAIELGEWHSIGPFRAKDFNTGFADSFGPEVVPNLDLTATYQEGPDDKKIERKWTPQPDWKDATVYNDQLKGGNSVFYLQREIISPKAQSIGLSVSGNDGIKVWINGHLAGEERKGGDAKADELKLNLPLLKGKNRLFIKIANGSGTAGFYFASSLENDRVPKAAEPILKIEPTKWTGAQRNVIIDWFKPHDAEWITRNAALAQHDQLEPEPDLTRVYAAKTRGTTYQFGADTYNVFHLHRGNADNKKDLARPGFLRVLSRNDEAFWLGEADPQPDTRWSILTPVIAKAQATQLEIGAKGKVTATGTLPAEDIYTIELDAPDEATTITALRLQVSAAQTSNFVLNQVSARWIPASGRPKPIEFASAAANFDQAGFSAADVLSGEPDRRKGWAISGALGEDNELHLILKTPMPITGADGKIEVTLEQQSAWKALLIRDLTFSITNSPEAENWIAELRQPAPVDADKMQPRQALGEWMTDVDAGAGPLLARVIVNRLWQHHFGRGIVTTPSDFGLRGERPTHPELLDWLAGQLLENDWQLKPIHRLIMTSATYMQGGGDAAGGLSHDPENLLYWRKSSRRLEAEIIRDNLLGVSGTLDAQAFGPGKLDANTPRRSVYLTVKRGQLIEMLQLFDAPDAMQSIGARETSTVAPQALAMLNSPTIRAWAIELANRAKPDADVPLGEAIDAAYQITYARPPSTDERTAMQTFIARQTQSRDGTADTAFQDFCHLLLCANEFVYVD